MTKQEQLLADAETLERAHDILLREGTKKTLWTDILYRILVDTAARFRREVRSGKV
jgi:hypothetical protein